MNINVFDVFYILFAHWVADFIFQTDWQAKNKSKNNLALFRHVLNYSLIVTFLIGIVKFNFLLLLLFLIITFISHFTTDYFTSRLNSYLWAKGDVHNFFVSVGFDQLLHYFQLITTYYLFL